MIAAHIPNVFDQGRFGARVRFVDTAADAAELGPSLVIVDLDRCQDIAGFRLPGIRVIGFGSHVDTDTHQRARDLGYDRVLPRSQFFRQLDDLLSSAASSTEPEP